MTKPGDDGTKERDVSDDMLMALADGELDAAIAAGLMARIGRDPVLAERYADFAMTRALVSGAMHPGPVPERLVAAIREAEVVPAAPAGVVALDSRRARFALAAPKGWAVAASLVVAVGLGGFVGGRMSVGPAGDPALAAAAVLQPVLTGGTAPMPDGGTARALAAFETDLGLCRLIAVAGGDGSAEQSVVCRTDGTWRVALAVTAAPEEAFLPASDTAAALVDQFLTDMNAGEPLSPEAEAAALGH